MFKRMFGAPKGTSASGGTKSVAPQETMSAVGKLEETKEMLGKRQLVIERKIAAEVAKAKEYAKAKNKRMALACLKRRKMYEGQLDQIQSYIEKLDSQLIAIQSAQDVSSVTTVIKDSNVHMKNMQKQTNIDAVENLMDDVMETHENQRAIQDALGQPLGMAADLDEDELEAELADLEAETLDESLLEPVSTGAVPGAQVPAQPAHVPSMPAVPSHQPTPAQPNTAEEDAELEALQAEMAL
mmetsp:Transcript_4570/g.16370  ORF Transcript_4570/g.16370 Transcript_4570/m.16370 type:complete len:241 (+) Transcript_4570:337-1059(+)